MRRVIDDFPMLPALEPPVHVVGGGLAGSECAFQLAERGTAVVLHEMRPERSTPAHKTGRFAELVCSNSFRSDDPLHAAGLLKREMEAFGSLVLAEARRAAVPAGGALAMDRDRFAEGVTARLAAHPRVEIRHDEVTAIPAGEAVIATGPLTSPAMSQALGELLGSDYLYFYDAIAPIVDGDSLDTDRLFWQSRYGKGDGDDYLNSPLDEAAVPRLPHRPPGGRGPPPARLRARAVLRGVPADRGAGPPRARHPPLRADEAGGADRPRRPPPVGGGAAPPRGPGEEPVQPRRLPVADDLARAEAGAAPAPRPRAGASSSAWGRSTATPSSTPPPTSTATTGSRRPRASVSPARSPASRGTWSRRPPASPSPSTSLCSAVTVASPSRSPPPPLSVPSPATSPSPTPSASSRPTSTTACSPTCRSGCARPTAAPPTPSARTATSPPGPSAPPSPSTRARSPVSRSRPRSPSDGRMAMRWVKKN